TLTFLFTDTATTALYTLSLHDALPISHGAESGRAAGRLWNRGGTPGRCARGLRGCGQDSFAGAAGTPRLLLPRSGTERGHGHGALQPHQSLRLQRTAHGTAERAAGAAGGYQRGRASVGKDTAPASDARIVPGVQRTRATPRPWAGLCRRAGARQPETLHRAGARRSRGR